MTSTAMTCKVRSARRTTACQMPALGLGAFPSPPTTQIGLTASKNSALRHGYRLIDTAAAYLNERRVGQGSATVRRSSR